MPVGRQWDTQPRVPLQSRAGFNGELEGFQDAAWRCSLHIALSSPLVFTSEQQRWHPGTCLLYIFIISDCVRNQPFPSRQLDEFLKNT